MTGQQRKEKGEGPWDSKDGAGERGTERKLQREGDEAGKKSGDMVPGSTTQLGRTLYQKRINDFLC